MTLLSIPTANKQRVLKIRFFLSYLVGKVQDGG